MIVATIINNKNGSKKVLFNPTGICILIREKLSYRFEGSCDAGVYLKEENGVFRKSKFSEMKKDLMNYILNNFEALEIDGKIEVNEFHNAFFKQIPITSNYLIKRILNENNFKRN